MFLPPLRVRQTNPTLQLQDDLQLVEHLDRLGYDEAWIGEHHSGGAELVGSPEVFIAAAAERTQRIRLGTGVNSLPYHHPFVLADRWVLLSHLTRGRAMFGAGPGSLPTDAWQMGLDVLEARETTDAALEVILALLRGEEPVTRETKWFSLRDARLQLRPYGNSVDVCVAALASPSGPRAAGRHGIGMLSLAGSSPAGFEAMRGAWGIVEARAQEFGQTVDRSNWRVVSLLHLADSVEQARKEVEYGLSGWVHYYKKLATLPISAEADDVAGAIEELTAEGIAVIGTPDMAIAMIERLLDQSGGFGCFLIQDHDWADPAASRRSYELFAQEVMPHFQGSLTARVANREWVMNNATAAKAEFAQAQHNATQQHEREQRSTVK
jgi:limonene 1,2-monooxygenase